MRDYERRQYFFLILFHIVIYSTERVEFFVSCFVDIKNMQIKGIFIINSYVNEDFGKDKELFDFSNYLKDSKYFNNLVAGKMK